MKQQALGKLLIQNLSRTEQPQKERVVVSGKISTKDAIAGRYREV